MTGIKVEFRSVRYRNSTTIPLFKNPLNLTGTNYEI